MPRHFQPARLMLLALTLLGFTMTVPRAWAAPRCTNVAGEIFFVTTSPPCGEGTVTGDLEGTQIGCVLDVRPSGNHGALHVVAENTFFPDGGGSFSTFATAALAPTITPNVYLMNSRFEIVGGTGGLEGATGFLQVQTIVDFNVGTSIGTYHGRICVP
jgi:hypothetical protein